jgi:hypothetical protein
MAKKKQVERLIGEFDWDDGQSEILNGFLVELVDKCDPDYDFVGRALLHAYLSIPEGKQSTGGR